MMTSIIAMFSVRLLFIQVESRVFANQMRCSNPRQKVQPDSFAKQLDCKELSLNKCQPEIMTYRRFLLFWKQTQPRENPNFIFRTVRFYAICISAALH